MVPAQHHRGIGHRGGSEADRIATVATVMSGHGLDGGENIVCVIVAHREGAITGTLEAVVEGQREILEAVGHARQRHLGGVAVACRATRHQEEGVVGDVTDVLVAAGGDDMGAVGGIAAVPAEVPAGGQLTLRVRGRRSHTLEVLGVGDGTGTAVNHLQHRHGGVGAVGVGRNHRERVGTPRLVHQRKRREKCCDGSVQQRGVPREGATVGGAIVDRCCKLRRHADFHPRGNRQRHLGQRMAAHGDHCATGARAKDIRLDDCHRIVTFSGVNQTESGL